MEMDFYFDYSYQTIEAEVANNKTQGRTMGKKKRLQGKGAERIYNYLNKLILCKIKIPKVLFLLEGQAMGQIYETDDFRPKIFSRHNH